MGVRRLKSLSNGDQQAHRLGGLGLAIKVVELADNIEPINWRTVAMLMIAAVKDNLQLIPRRRQVFVGQGAAANSIWPVWNMGS